MESHLGEASSLVAEEALMAEKRPRPVELAADRSGKSNGPPTLLLLLLFVPHVLVLQSKSIIRWPKRPAHIQ